MLQLKFLALQSNESIRSCHFFYPGAIGGLEVTQSEPPIFALDLGVNVADRWVLDDHIYVTFSPPSADEIASLKDGLFVFLIDNVCLRIASVIFIAVAGTGCIVVLIVDYLCDMHFCFLSWFHRRNRRLPFNDLGMHEMMVLM
jgi:hypothetical protein